MSKWELIHDLDIRDIKRTLKQNRRELWPSNILNNFLYACMLGINIWSADFSKNNVFFSILVYQGKADTTIDKRRLK